MKKRNQFKSASVPRTPRSIYDKSADFLYTQHFGSILPVAWQDLAPGESFSMRESCKMLSVPYFAPMFSRIRSKTRYFAVPVRKLVPYWEKFCTQLPDDGIVEPYTTVGDVFISAYGQSSPLSTGNLIVQQSINPGGLADMLGWPQFIDQLHIVTTGYDTQQYQEILAGNPGLTDMWSVVIWPAITASIQANISEAEGEERIPLDPVVYSYVADLSDPAKPAWSRLSQISLKAFFSQRLRLLPFLAYQKVIFDWIVDLRFLDDQFTLLNPYFESTPYVSWLSEYTISADDAIAGVAYNVRILPFLLSTRVVDYAKDYFTTCSSQPQQGPDLVIGPEKLQLMFDVETPGVSSESAHVGPGSLVDTGDNGQLLLTNHEGGGSAIGKVWAEVNQADEITPIKLRWQMALQRMLELRNIGGYRRYTDFVLGQYGIRVPDPYMQRSFYLGGWSQDLNTNEVVAMADGNDGEGNSSIIADQGAYGRNFSSGPGFSCKIANEHVVVLALNYVVPQNYYTQGIATRNTEIGLLDWPHYQFAQVGEQPVYEREIFFGLEPDKIFGYNRRYSDRTDYRDQVHGEFLSTLRYWRTGRKFLNQPKLGSALLPLRGTDGHNQVLAVEPSVAEPFRMIRYQSIRHTMCIPRIRQA